MKKIFFLFLILSIFLNIGCERKPASSQSVQTEKKFSVLVFITGIIAGSPTYELLAEGALEFAKVHPEVNVKIYEAGTNQGEWEQQLGEMIWGGEYDVVLGSNPSLPEICASAAKMFPEQKFIITDAFYEGHPQIRTYLYNQYEQSLFLGYLAGLVTTSGMRYANSQKKIGFIAAQEYPLLTRQMVPGFLEGARLVDPSIELDFRVVGSWVDANKTAELASAMMDAGVDVFTAIAGGAAQGLLKTSAEKGSYVLWYNTNAYSQSPSTIVGCGIMEQKKLAFEILEDALAGRIRYGEADTLGIKDGYLDFISDDPVYQNNLPSDIRQRFERFLDDLRAGRINYTVPQL